MARLVTGNARHFTIYFEHKGKQVPYFVSGWEDLFINSNFMDRAIYSIEKHTRLSQNKITYLETRCDSNCAFLTICNQTLAIHENDLKIAWHHNYTKNK